MRNIFEKVRQNRGQLTILIICISCVVCILLLLGNRWVQENLLIKGIIFTYIIASFLYFVLTYRRELIPALKKYFQDSIRKSNPDILFPGDEGYEEALEAQREQKQNKKGMRVVKSTQNENDE